MATKIMWGIAFNIYAAERYCKKKMEGRKAFALEWFGSIFNANNVEDYKGFIKEFNAPAEYSRKSDDIQSMESHYDCPENIEESKFYRTVKVGFGGSYAIENCKTRDELERVACEVGMSKRTTYRKAKEFGLPRKERKPHNPHKSKLDKYVALSKDELDELVKKGILNRMDKCRIIKKRNKSLIGYIQ